MSKSLKRVHIYKRDIKLTYTHSCQPCIRCFTLIWSMCLKAIKSLNIHTYYDIDVAIVSCRTRSVRHLKNRIYPYRINSSSPKIRFFWILPTTTKHVFFIYPDATGDELCTFFCYKWGWILLMTRWIYAMWRIRASHKKGVA